METQKQNADKDSDIEGEVKKVEKEKEINSANQLIIRAAERAFERVATSEELK